MDIGLDYESQRVNIGSVYTTIEIVDIAPVYTAKLSFKRVSIDSDYTRS